MNTETNTEPEVNPADAIRILKTATCPSLSGKSTLTYNIGCNALSVVQFQVAGNDGGGYFNDDWIPQSSIQAVLDKQPHGKDIPLRRSGPSIPASQTTHRASYWRCSRPSAWCVHQPPTNAATNWIRQTSSLRR